MNQLSWDYQRVLICFGDEDQRQASSMMKQITPLLHGWTGMENAVALENIPHNETITRMEVGRLAVYTLKIPALFHKAI